MGWTWNDNPLNRPQLVTYDYLYKQAQDGKAQIAADPAHSVTVQQIKAKHADYLKNKSNKAEAAADIEKKYGLPTGTISGIAQPKLAATTPLADPKPTALPTQTLAAPSRPGYAGSAPTSSWYTPMTAAERNRIADQAGGGAQAMANLQSEFKAKAADIASRYRLSVTPEEKAQLQWELDSLTNQAKAAQGAIDTTYGQAYTAANTAKADITKAAPGWSAALQGVYNSGAASVAANRTSAADMAGASDTAGSGLVALDVAGPDMSAMLSSQGVAEGARSLNDSSMMADDLTWLAATGKQEQAAQVGQVQNATTTLKGQAQAEARKAWNDRITKEWEAQQAALDNLDSTYTSRGWSLSDARNKALTDLSMSDYDNWQSANKDLWGAKNTYQDNVAAYNNAFNVKDYETAQTAYAAQAQASGTKPLPIGKNDGTVVLDGKGGVPMVASKDGSGAATVDLRKAKTWYNGVIQGDWNSPDAAKRYAYRSQIMSAAPPGFVEALELRTGVDFWS